MRILKEVLKRKKILLSQQEKSALQSASYIAKILGQKFNAEKVILYASLTGVK